MYSRCLSCLLALAIAGLSGCLREDRGPPSMSPLVHTPHPVLVDRQDRREHLTIEHGYTESAYAINQGQQLFQQFNCVGCHAHGGGGMGPPLMDGEWIYGEEPSAVFTTIAEGRPNGMPSFGGAVPREEILQLTAYVRSLSGLTRKDSIPSRADAIMSIPARNVTPTEKLQ